jgi:hypothetical protein
MANRLVILTGACEIIGKIIRANITTFGNLRYYPSIADDLKQGAPNHWQSCPFFYALVMEREINRDIEILSLFSDGKATVFVEEWHIGNIAWAMAQSRQFESMIGQEYEGGLPGILGRFGESDIEVWYVSTDIERYPQHLFRELYRAYLEELSGLTDRLGLSITTLDYTTEDSVTKRVSYLLAGKVSR